MTALVSLDSVAGPLAGAQPDAPGGTVLEILDGLHQGVSLPLGQAVYRIGNSPDSDLILGDDGIAAQHLVLRVLPDQVAVEARGGDVSVATLTGVRQLIAQGHGLKVRLPVELAFGEARLRLRDTRPAVAPVSSGSITSRHWSRHCAALVAVLLLVLCTLAFAFRSEPAAPVPPSAEAKAATIPAVDATPEQAHAWLEESLRAAGLGFLQARVNGRHISVTGSYPATLKDRWLGVQQGFDSRFGQHTVLTPDVQATATVAKPRTRFQAVWFGANPYVIDEHGKRLYPGATLEDNWVLDSIEGDQVRLTRGHERFVFTL